MNDKQLNALKIIYDIIKKAHDEVANSDEVEALADTRWDEAIGTWVLDTRYMLSFMNEKLV